MDSIRDGSFAEIESLVVPYKIGEEEFTYTYFLTDGIYPPYSRFVKAILNPFYQRRKHTLNGRKLYVRTLNVPLVFFKPSGSVLPVLFILWSWNLLGPWLHVV